MIARRWYGRVPDGKAEAYLRLTREVALSDYRWVSGKRGSWCLHRKEGDVVHVEMFSLREDADAIRRFAGDDVDIAKYCDFDDQHLLEKEPRPEGTIC